MTEPVSGNGETPTSAVLVFGDRRVPRPLRGLAALRPASRADSNTLDAAVGPHRRLVVLGDDADLAAVLTRLLRAERLDVEVAYVPRRRTAATRAYRLPSGHRAARRARRGAAHRVPLIRDDTGCAIAGRARWLPADDGLPLHGEAIVDDTTLFDGDVAAVRIEPTRALPGLRARVSGRGWVPGRAAQLGCTGVIVVRDGVAAPRPARRSTLYRHVEGWLAVG
ncbi:peptidase M50 [Mycobacterium servetii]|uniref:Peptidase M50 n=1 Tax=Mycobacterium servetii TaxID=3237418 RepID=A0ABV4C6Z4_9MYCO